MEKVVFHAFRTKRLVFYPGLLYLCSSLFAFGESWRHSHRSVIKYEYDDTCSKDCSQSVSTNLLSETRVKLE